MDLKCRSNGKQTRIAELKQMTNRSENQICQQKAGFTLIELLVVVAIIALLISILIPCLAAARDSARSSVCASNIRQLAIANQGYAMANKGHYVLAAEDIMWGLGGTKRWHGQRKSPGLSTNPQENRFDPARSPLARYMGSDGQVKQCPIFRSFVEDEKAFEANCGGYGYNDKYIGGRFDSYTGIKASQNSAKTCQVQRPTATVMFTDTAMIKMKLPGPQPYLIEYSFCEPPFFVDVEGKLSDYHASASIQFRHRNKTNVAWADGHVDQQPMTFSRGPNAYRVHEHIIRAYKIGWFGPKDNSLFDLN
ncbi:MAG: prepilin-type N-terminal cleavage/methylation domain-containing protein [Planctomycetota bacterium]|nr:MAG: prepilin-type N-terminal cleavage/methylation domain-containing protein [Planctomycetota bacterium]